MSVIPKSKRLKKELTLFKIYALATGATLSSGFFLLPGLAAAEAGPAVTLSYVLAALHLIPAVFCMAELSTAMPRAGGLYYFIDRSLGPMLGTVAGLGTWLALILKIAFALIGMGAYLALFLPGIQMLPIAIVLAAVFGLINLFGVKKSGGFQVMLVFGLLTILAAFTGLGLFNLKSSHFSGYLSKGWGSIYVTAGFVYISYVGLTKIASVSEEVQNPERNLPLGMLLALVTALSVYILGITVLVGILPANEFHDDLTPVTSAARVLAGPVGGVLITIAAVLAFFSVANSGILSASRYPLAMSRDHLTPRLFRALNKHKTPKFSIYITTGLIILCLLLFDPTKIAKLASAFQLLLFSLSCLAVIIMRESHLYSYDPGYRSPFYPWLHLVGVLAPLVLITQMGSGPILFTLGLFVSGIIWYLFYASKRVDRSGAIFHVFARWGQQRHALLDRELRGILQEKGLREEDPFEVVVARAAVVDLKDPVEFDEVVKRASEVLAQRLPRSAEELAEDFMQGTQVGATPVTHGVALPHLRTGEVDSPEMVIVRTKRGVHVEVDHDHVDHSADKPVYAFFFLISPERDPGQHLRLLAQIAEQVDDDRFMKQWLRAKSELELKAILHRDEHFLSLTVSANTENNSLSGMAVRDLNMPEGTLIAVIHRESEIIIPRGKTILKEHDRLAIIGDPEVLQAIREKYATQT